MHSTLRFLPSVFIKKRPIHLAFFVTKRCNARCPFCFYLENKTSAGTGETELTLEEIRRVSRSMGSLLWIAFSGGEIYLREDIVQISRLFYDNNKPSIMLFPTNGLAPDLIRTKTEEILRHCPESVVTVKLSIDGLGDKHDAMRGVKGAFDKVMTTYEALGPLLDRHRNFELGANTVFCTSNQDYMGGIIDFVKGLGMIRTHTISLVRGNIKDASYKETDMVKYLEAVTQLERNIRNGGSPTYGFRGAGIKAAQDIMQRRLIHKTVKENRKAIQCYAGRLNIVLTETGDLYPCESFDENHRFGNIRDHDCNAIKMLKTERARDIVSAITEKCFCTHECYMMTNILFNPTMYPALLREYLRIKRFL
jgi:radical SAM protein with 4Fe4S-binding SPASM domain